MLRKWFRHATTHSLPAAAALGYVSELARHEARHRRNTAAWAPHLARTREALAQAARRAPGRDLAVVAGSGLCLDFDLPGLAREFTSVVLVDVVHPLEVRRLASRLGNVSLCTSDLTGVLELVARAAAAGRRQPLPSPSFDIPLPGRPDLVASLNTLAQLPLLPVEALWRTGFYADEELELFSRAVMRVHLDWLRGFGCARCLVTDIAWTGVTSEAPAMAASPLRGIMDEPPLERWEWLHAPRPEAHPVRDVVHVVGSFTLSG